jgi:hypothetical protein
LSKMLVASVRIDAQKIFSRPPSVKRSEMKFLTLPQTET